MAPWSRRAMSSILRRFCGVLPGVDVGDELRRGFEDGLDDAQLVGAQRRAGLRDLDDGVGELGQLGLGGAPAELDAGAHAAFRQPAPGDADELGGHDPALEVGYRLDSRRLRHGQHPAHPAEALLGVDEVAHRVHGGLVLDHPVVAGEAAVEGAVLHVARHLLGAQQHALDLGIVDGGVVGTIRHGDEEPGAAHQVEGRRLEASLGQAHLECHVWLPAAVVVGGRASRRVAECIARHGAGRPPHSRRHRHSRRRDAPVRRKPRAGRLSADET